jgi:hypothetical protein
LIVESKDAPKICFKTYMKFGGNTSIRPCCLNQSSADPGKKTSLLYPIFIQ